MKGLAILAAVIAVGFSTMMLPNPGKIGFIILPNPGIIGF